MILRSQMRNMGPFKVHGKFGQTTSPAPHWISDLVRGISLAQFATEIHPLPQVEILSQVCKGLEHEFQGVTYVIEISWLLPLAIRNLTDQKLTE